jgi:flagellar L-ring protein precursor FlgH
VAAGDSLNVLSADTTSTFEGDGETSREGRFNAVVTCRVLDTLPGGVLHLRGRRTVIVNHEQQLLTVEGLVRREDIGINNTVLSSALADARLTYDGIGVVDDKQRPPFIARLFDWLYPL